MLLSSKRAVCWYFCSEKFRLQGSELVFGSNMGLFPHLSRARIWMLRVTMLIRMIIECGFQMPKSFTLTQRHHVCSWTNTLTRDHHWCLCERKRTEKTVCQSVAWFKRYKTLKSVTVGRSLNLRKFSYSAKTRSAFGLARNQYRF